MTVVRWTSSVGLALSATIAITVGLWRRAPLDNATGPIARFTAPIPGFKLRQGRETSVRVQVQPGQRPLRAWTLTLSSSAHGAVELAEGTGPVTDSTVATVAADRLEPGATYLLTLEVQDTVGTATTDTVTLFIPDLQYAVIPLEQLSMSRIVQGGLALDGSGGLAAIGGERFYDINLVHAGTGSVEQLRVPLQATDAFQLSQDGKRLVYAGAEPFALGFVDLDSHIVRNGVATRGLSQFFTADRTGQRVAVQAPCVAGRGAPQYCVYDDLTKTTVNLTNDENAIDFYGSCPAIVGTTPVISADGTTVAFATSAALGLVPADPAAGCHIFAYDIASATLRHVRTLPRGDRFDLPAISGDGQWLTFVMTRPVPPNGRRDYGVRLNLRTGQMDDSIGGITDYTTFDAVISSDASAIVVSTQADLDPRVGNADHNMELFAYDTTSGEFTQITETTGGIGQFPGGCGSYQPRVSTDAHAVAFFFAIGSGEGCQLDGPQRNEADGFTFQRVRAVRKRPGNHGPVFQTTSSARAVAGETLTLQFAASDPDGDAIVFFAQEVGTTDLPRGSDMLDHRDGTAILTWPTEPQDIGVHHLRVAAFDQGGGETVQDVTITVCDHIVDDGTLPGVLAALFEAASPAPCHDADGNHDGAITAADVVKATASNY